MAKTQFFSSWTNHVWTVSHVWTAVRPYVKLDLKSKVESMKIGSWKPNKIIFNDIYCGQNQLLAELTKSCWFVIYIISYSFTGNIPLGRDLGKIYTFMCLKIIYLCWLFTDIQRAMESCVNFLDPDRLLKCRITYLIKLFCITQTRTFQYPLEIK